MQGSSPLDNYDTVIAAKSLKMLLIDRSNEFRELAHGMGYPSNTKDWETIILNFCLDFNDCFKAWSDKTAPSDHNTVHKCMTQMRQIAMGKTNMIEVTKLQNLAYTIAEEFKSIYNRLK
ncbi:MAG: hypothetical protein ACT4N5_07030 [Nitrosopumilaceae archaeon]